jgi:hypothetical protein
MWQSIIAILGTLAGAAVTALFQQRAAAAERRETRTADHRRDVLAAVTNLVTALADHRRAMWVREDARLSGTDAERLATLRDASHTTRAAVTAPHVTLTVLAPNLTAAVNDAVNSTYALRGAETPELLDERRTAALAAADALTTTAAATLAA